MKTLLLLCLAVASTLPASAADKPAGAKPPEGTWKLLAATLAGQPMPPALMDSIVLKLAGDTYEVTVDGKADKGTAKVDTSVTPHRMAITGTLGPNAGKTFLAIYEVKDADHFRVCYDLSGKAYPTGFQSEAGTQHYLVSYTRKKE